MQVYKNVIVYLVCSLLLLSSRLNVTANECLVCPSFANRTVHKSFRDLMQYSDEKKIVPKEPDDKPDPELEKCLNPGYKLIAELSDIICSGSSDGKCHTVSPKFLRNNSHVLCHLCQFMCGCSKDFAVSRSLPDSYFIFMTAFLALFYKGAPMTI